MLVLVRMFKHDTLSGEISPDSGISHCILTTKPEGHTTYSALRIIGFAGPKAAGEARVPWIIWISLTILI